MHMWKVNPKIMCGKHLLGEHLECHMFLGAMRKGISLDGYIKNNMFEVRYLVQRHAELVVEMIARGYNHNSPLDIEEYIKYVENYDNIEINVNKALTDLLTRCTFCANKHKLHSEVLKSITIVKTNFDEWGDRINATVFD